MCTGVESFVPGLFWCYDLDFSTGFICFVVSQLGSKRILSSSTHYLFHEPSVR